jgi:diadenosine tetraphosphate (Ap4A) HIT family hydrolase
VRTGGGLSECFSCRQAAELDRVPRKHILFTDSWTVAHAFDTGLPGWVVLLPIRHVIALHELTSEEAAELGPLLRDLSIALQKVVGCEKTYVMLFAEAEGFAHLHFHVVPRMPDQPEELRGPGVFGMLGLPAESRVPDAEMDRVAVAIRHALGKT